jgi:type I restriction enzyme, S subunit
MAGKWDTVALERLVDPDRGISYGIVQPGSPVSDGVPIVRVSDVRNGRIDTANPLIVASDIEAAHSRTRLRGGELLLTLVGTVGEAAVVPESLAGWNTARAVAVIPVRKEIGSYWVQMALRSPMVRSIIDSRLNTTVQATLNLRDVAQLPIILPPQQEREAIVYILGTLDDKIELNQRMNETLEAMARALFKSWFVDFDPIRAKADGRAPNFASELWSLFPNTLDANGKPSEWQDGILLDLCELKRGYDLPTAQRSSGLIPIISSSGISGYHSMPMAEPPGVVTGRYGTIGEVFFINDPYWPLNTALYVRDFKGNSPRFVYYMLREIDFLKYSDKAAVPGINRNHLHEATIILPPRPVQEAFERLLTPLWLRQDANNAETALLSAMRDTLLPKLISGELRVKDAEHLAAASA